MAAINTITDDSIQQPEIWLVMDGQKVSLGGNIYLPGTVLKAKLAELVEPNLEFFKVRKLTDPAMVCLDCNKVFVGKTTVVNTKFGQIVKVALGPQDFEVLTNNKNDKGWVNLEIKDKRDGGKYIQLQGEMPQKAMGVNDTDDGMPF